MCVHFCSVISFNEIADLDMDLDSIMGFRAHLMEKMRALVGVHYQLHSNGADYLKSLRTNWTFLDPNPDEVYDN